jgi:hypothetical protein
MSGCEVFESNKSMKETANVAPGFPGGTFEAPGMVRLRDPLIERANKATTSRKLIPLLLIALAIAA